MVLNHTEALYIQSFHTKNSNNTVNQTKSFNKTRKRKSHSYVFFCSMCMCVKNEKRREREKKIFFLDVGKATACFKHHHQQ